MNLIPLDRADAVENFLRFSDLLEIVRKVNGANGQSNCKIQRHVAAEKVYLKLSAVVLPLISGSGTDETFKETIGFSSNSPGYRTLNSRHKSQYERGSMAFSNQPMLAYFRNNENNGHLALLGLKNKTTLDNSIPQNMAYDLDFVGDDDMPLTCALVCKDWAMASRQHLLESFLIEPRDGLALWDILESPYATFLPTFVERVQVL
ncbi:hypothetical protein C8J56DRAFT_890371 [Mycena floridula]|nr:hypothetical protein C8J56DRAFT_890371 [Mycena floridula]